MDIQQAVKEAALPEIRDYEMVSKIGQGGIAGVYKARQISLDRFVAIKILSPDLIKDPDIVRRFERESTTIAALNHPNIVHVIDRGKAGDSYYFVMEHVDGTSFKDIIYSNAYSSKQKFEIIVMILKGLDYAHKNGVIHRDIKPANILIDQNGNALIADFGIAHITNKNDYEMTSSDVIMGTVAYMSPEQKISAANITPAADIYSVGVMIYEILTGNKPLGRFKLPSELNPGLSKRFDEIISRCLAADPNERYQKAFELKDAILNAVTASSPAPGAARGGYPGADTFIGKCQFLDTLKETKFSSTMLVENGESHELYVIKKNGRSQSGLKEIRLLSNLKHPNIIDIYGAGSDNRHLVIVMEYAPGGSLADRMVQTYPFQKAMGIIVAVADALDFAQRNGIIHGNLRPSNILFTKDDVIKVSDFALPPHYSLMDKNWYVPPEKRVSKQGDVYSLGVILHQMLFGNNPIYDRASNLFLGRVNHIIPAGMEKILGKLLAIRVSQRYLGVEEFLHDWDDLQRSLSDSKKLPAPVLHTEERHSFGKILPYVVGAAAGIIIILSILLLSGVSR